MLHGRKILLTGLTGQVGGTFADALAPHNEVYGLARFSRPGSREHAEAAGVRTIVGDLAENRLDGIPNDLDVVIHLAANTKPGTAEVGMRENAEGTGFLMHRCRGAKAFIFVSNNSLYADHPDPLHRYAETDHVGGNSPHSANYGPTKLAAEGVVRFLCRLYGTPTLIARLNVSYGSVYDDGGLPGNLLEALIAGRPIKLAKSRATTMSPISETDMLRHLEPMVRACSVPATIVNWGGDEAVGIEEMARYMAELIGVEPKFDFTDEGVVPNRITDPSFGRSIGLEWRVPWRAGIKDMIQARHPELKLQAVA
ncbi:MAG: dependent epimerase/dehydratase [Phenylobacterium sp.]|nr:dependent epimerase/dehydratase [Phenylobacterium sp.]